jgi:anti-anti-sigma factor
MDVTTRDEGSCRVIGLHGSADAAALAPMREALLSAIDSGETRLVCDLSDTDFICSDALGVLITAYIKARGRGGYLHLATPQPRLRNVLQTTRLDHLFEVFTDVGCALHEGRPGRGHSNTDQLRGTRS